MTTSEILSALRKWLLSAEQEEAVAPGVFRGELISAWATLAFEDNVMWTYADEKSANNAGRKMLAALDDEPQLKVRDIEGSFHFAINMLGTNGGGFFNANAAHPFENPKAATGTRKPTGTESPCSRPPRSP